MGVATENRNFKFEQYEIVRESIGVTTNFADNCYSEPELPEGLYIEDLSIKGTATNVQEYKEYKIYCKNTHSVSNKWIIGIEIICILYLLSS